MTPTVVVVGGTGAFGERLVRGLLATTDMRVVVAARRMERARALADALGGLPRVTAARLDVASVNAEALRTLGAFAVVDTAGPYRPGAHRLARAAIQAGIHYLDLADGRAYVAGFAAALDGPARAAGVVALAGCSSTPALSCAVLDHMTAGWTRVDPGGRHDPAGQPRAAGTGGDALHPVLGRAARAGVPGRKLDHTARLGSDPADRGARARPPLVLPGGHAGLGPGAGPLPRLPLRRFPRRAGTAAAALGPTAGQPANPRRMPPGPASLPGAVGPSYAVPGRAGAWHGHRPGRHGG